jgi:hypothetical protein
VSDYLGVLSHEDIGNHVKAGAGIRFANLPTHGPSASSDAGDPLSSGILNPFPNGYTKESFIEWLDSIEWGNCSEVWGEEGQNEAHTQVLSKGSATGKKTPRY